MNTLEPGKKCETENYLSHYLYYRNKDGGKGSTEDSWVTLVPTFWSSNV